MVVYGPVYISVYYTNIWHKQLRRAKPFFYLLWDSIWARNAAILAVLHSPCHNSIESSKYLRVYLWCWQIFKSPNRSIMMSSVILFATRSTLISVVTSSTILSPLWWLGIRIFRITERSMTSSLRAWNGMPGHWQTCIHQRGFPD